jgi:hypothetical protein
MGNVIKFPGRKRIIVDDYRLTPDQAVAVGQWAEQTLEDIEAEIMRDDLDDAIRRVLREEGLIP